MNRLRRLHVIKYRKARGSDPIIHYPSVDCDITPEQNASQASNVTA